MLGGGGRLTTANTALRERRPIPMSLWRKRGLWRDVSVRGRVGIRFQGNDGRNGSGLTQGGMRPFALQSKDANHIRAARRLVPVASSRQQADLDALPYRRVPQLKAHEPAVDPPAGSPRVPQQWHGKHHHALGRVSMHDEHTFVSESDDPPVSLRKTKQIRQTCPIGLGICKCRHFHNNFFINHLLQNSRESVFMDCA